MSAILIINVSISLIIRLMSLKSISFACQHWKSADLEFIIYKIISCLSFFYNILLLIISFFNKACKKHSTKVNTILPVVALNAIQYLYLKLLIPYVKHRQQHICLNKWTVATFTNYSWFRGKWVYTIITGLLLKIKT